MADFAESKASQLDCNRCKLWPTLVAVLVAALTTLTVGYAVGYPSAALGDLAGLPDGYAFELSSKFSGLFAALVPVGALLSCSVVGVLSDWIGWKKVMVVSGFPNAIGWIMIIASPYIANPPAFRWVILSGRFLTGIASGWLTAVAPFFMAEVAIPKYRGQFTAFFHLSMIAGIFISYGVGAIPGVRYNQSAVVVTGIVVIFEILLLMVPESPRWLLSKGHEARAMKALQWLRRSEEIAREEADEIMKFIETTPKLSLKEKLLEFRKRNVYLPVILVIPLIFFVDLSGVNVINAFSAVILQASGISRARETALCATGGLQLIGAIFSSILVDKVGRKPLLILGGIGTVIGNVGLGTYFYITRPSLCEDHGSGTVNSSLVISNSTDGLVFSDNSTDEVIDNNVFCNPQNALAICSLATFCFTNGLGWRCVPAIMRTEIYPLRLRGVLSGISDFISWWLVAIIVGFYYDYGKAVGQSGLWWSFAMESLLGLLFIIAFIPETKGKTLEEIETHFKTNHSFCLCTNIVRLKTTPSRLKTEIAIYEESAV